jgi:hypothetical protein
MSNNSGPAAAAAKTQGQNADEALGAYQGDIGTYMSNVNSALSAGNPFESKDYLTQQNLDTSGAMNSENTAAKQQQEQQVARTGTNSAALANDVASSARQGQRDLTQYNAGRNTTNENTWLQDQNQLMGDQLAGANSEAGVYGTGTGAQTSDINTETQANDAYDQMWASMAGAAAQGAGVGAGIAMH